MPVIEELDDDAPLEEEREKWRQRQEEQEQEEQERVARQFELGEERKLEGVRLYKEGNYTGALAAYNEALHELTLVGNLPENREKADRANLAIHLNHALAGLKLGDAAALEEAVHQATCALIIDPRSVKALYRRGLARAAQARGAALFQEGRARAALKDFDDALKVEPANAEAKGELQRLRAELRAHERDLADRQRETWAKVFGGRTVTDGDDDAAPEAPLAPVRACRNRGEHDGHHLLASAEGASVAGRGGGPAISGVDLELREKWCIGFCGDREGRAALGQLFHRTAAPSSGEVIIHPKKHKAGKQKREETAAAAAAYKPVLFGFVGLIVVLMITTEMSAAGSFQLWSMRVFGTMTLLAFAFYCQLDGKPRLPLKTTYATSDPAALEAISPKCTIEEVIGSQMPPQTPSTKRRECIIGMLCAAGFQLQGGEGADGAPQGTPARCVEDGLKYGQLSAQQKHVVYMLRCLASRPEVLICDEPLRGLDGGSQARLLQMLKRMKRECLTSILYLSDDLEQLSIIADSLGLLAGGAVCEKGPTEEVLETPRRPETEAYIAGFKEGGGSTAIDSPLRARCAALIGDAALDGPWLPPLYRTPY